MYYNLNSTKSLALNIRVERQPTGLYRVEYAPLGTKGILSITTVSAENLTAHLQAVIAEEVSNSTGFSWTEYAAVERIYSGQVI